MLHVIANFVLRTLFSFDLRNLHPKEIFPSSQCHMTVLYVQVVRLCAKSREAIESSVSFLALHNQVRAHSGYVLEH